MRLDLSVVLDLLVIALLIATIVYAAMLNRRLAKLRDGRAEFESLVKDFTAAAARAESSVAALRKTALESGENLQKVVDKAVGLREELNIIVEAGNSLAARIERSAGSAASKGAVDGRPAMTAQEPRRAPADKRPGAEPKLDPARPSARPADSKPRAERELLDALENLR